METFFGYIQKLELLAFFSGYSLLYAIVGVVAGKKELRNNFKKCLITALPLSYAFTGTLYLGFQAKNLYHSHLPLAQNFHQPVLMLWAFLSILFWIPAIRKKQLLSFLHSLVFFVFLFKDVILQMTSSIDDEALRNDMKVYTFSILLNVGCFILMALLVLIIKRDKKPIRYS